MIMEFVLYYMNMGKTSYIQCTPYTISKNVVIYYNINYYELLYKAVIATMLQAWHFNLL